MTKLFIPILLGTARRKRQSEKVANFIHGEICKFSENIESDLIDVREFVVAETIRPEDENKKVSNWREVMDRADGLIIVSPEYNHGYPGELKIALDYLYEEYADKPVGICAVSSGHFGGARMVENLLPVLLSLRMHPLKNVLYFSNVEDLLDPSGNLKDDSYKKRAYKFFENIEKYAQGMKSLR